MTSDCLPHQVRLLFERLESGLITPQATIRPLSLLWYDSLDANGLPRLLLVESCLLGFVTFFMAYELQAMRREGLRSYWADKSNWYERLDCA